MKAVTTYLPRGKRDATRKTGASMFPSTKTGWLFSAQDLTAFLGCQHAAELNRRIHTDPAVRDWLIAANRAAKASADAAGLGGDEPAIARGLAHENAVLQAFKNDGVHVVQVATPAATDDISLTLAVSQTRDAMRIGADVIFQAALQDGPWVGFADFLVKQPGVTSDLGDYCYELHDTKLARTLKTNALIQLAHYGLMLEVMQGVPPPRLVVVLGTGEHAPWAFGDAAPYVERLRAKVLAFHHEQGTAAPEPVAACEGCRWLTHCESTWGDDDLLQVQRLNRRQRALLIETGIAGMKALASSSDANRPPRMAVETFDRLRAQARVQTGGADCEVIKPQPATGAFADVPAPHPLDIYFDLEGDPYAAQPTLDYLWAFCGPDDGYCHRWAHTPDEEREAFLWFMAELRARESQGGDWRVYHYNSYETTSLRRLTADWPDDRREALVVEVEHFIENRFDDLYRRVEVGLRTRDGSTSLKVVEKLAGYDRTRDAAAVAKGDDSIKAYELAIADGTPSERRQSLLDGIQHYNTHDVRATAAVHRWMHGVGATLTDVDVVHVEPEVYEQSEKVRIRIEKTTELEDRLLAAASVAEQNGRCLLSGLSVAGTRLLAGMLAWHRREDVVKWIDFFRLCEWAQRGEVESTETTSEPFQQAWTALNGDSVRTTATAVRPGTEHESVLQDLVVLNKEGPPAGTRKKKSTYTLSCRPGAWKVKSGDSLKLICLDKPEQSGTVELLDYDAQEGSAVVSTTGDLDGAHALVLSPFIAPEGPWLSLMRLAEAALSEEFSPEHEVGLRLLDRNPPRALAADGDRVDPATTARTVVARMQQGDLLPVQGPPGTGKTWLAAQIIIDEIERARAQRHAARIGVTANSHKVIDNLLTEVARLTREHGLPVQIGHVGSKLSDDAHPAIERIDSKALAELLAPASSGPALVIGATKFGWSREEVAGSLELLIIDEAGQVPLADALSVAQAAGRILAVGDPQQLAAPIQAAHDAEVKVSLLEHLIEGRATISPDAGVFLDVSHRMHPSLCRVVGRLAYASHLHASPAAASRRLEGSAFEIAGSILPMQPGVIHLPVPGGPDVEVLAVVELISKLTSGEVMATDMSAASADILAPIRATDVLVVAPHNAHVNRLRRALPGYEIGTVDKFQGRQAHVVVYAMGRTAESPSDVPFLYELNRVNVALSRARLLAIVVTSPEALLPPVAEPEHLRLASRFAEALSGR
jgi:predicted RecB family nuclease